MRSSEVTRMVLGKLEKALADAEPDVFDPSVGVDFPVAYTIGIEEGDPPALLFLGHIGAGIHKLIGLNRQVWVDFPRPFEGFVASRSTLPEILSSTTFETDAAAVDIVDCFIVPRGLEAKYACFQMSIKYELACPIRVKPNGFVVAVRLIGDFGVGFGVMSSVVSGGCFIRLLHACRERVDAGMQFTVYWRGEFVGVGELTCRMDACPPIFVDRCTRPPD